MVTVMVVVVEGIHMEEPPVEVVMVMPMMKRMAMLMAEKMDTLMKLLTKRIST